MSYYTALNEKTPKYGVLVWNDEGFEVYANCGRLYLFKNDYRMSELINGKSTLDKKFKGDYLRWIDSVKRKDLAKAESIKEKALLALKDANFIESLWQ